MWTYVQRTGELLASDGELAGVGYSGAGTGKNTPSAQAEPNIGPIPCGDYTIGEPLDLAGGPHGPFVLPLTPDPLNEMFGRSAFLVHGDSIRKPGTASRGCIVQRRSVRERVAESGDRRLRVVAERYDLST